MEVLLAITTVLLLTFVTVILTIIALILYSIYTNIGGAPIKLIDKVIKPVDSHNEVTPQEYEQTVPIESFEPDHKKPLKVKIIEQEDFEGIEES